MSRPDCTRCGEEMASRGRAGGWYCTNPACWALASAPPAPTPATGTPCHYCSGWVGHPDHNEACIRDPVRCVGMHGYTGDARPLTAPASSPGSGLRGAAEQAVHALRCVEEDDTAPCHLLKVSTAALASQARYALEVALAVRPEPERCPEVVRRGTHWPLDPGEPCAGCGVIVPGAPAPSTVEATGKPSSISPPSTPAETAPEQCVCGAIRIPAEGGVERCPSCGRGAPAAPEVPCPWYEDGQHRGCQHPAATEVDLGEVSERLDAYARVLDNAWSDEGPARAAREAVEAAVRSLVERARREDVRVLEAAAGAQTKPERWAVLREAADMLRALTPAVPGAADEEGEP